MILKYRECITVFDEDSKLKNYRKFLKAIGHQPPRICSCEKSIEKKHWIHAPCKTSKAHQEEKPRKGFSRSLSALDDMKSLPSNELDSEEEERTKMHHRAQSSDELLQQLHKETAVLKEALASFEEGKPLPEYVKSIVKKWSKRKNYGINQDGEERYSDGKKDMNFETETSEEKKKRSSEKNMLLQELQAKYDIAMEEEKILRLELSKISDELKLREGAEKENLKLKKKVMSLKSRLKRSKDVGRRDSIDEAQELQGRSQVVTQVLKKKYEDLLQYVLKVEAENQKLKIKIDASNQDLASATEPDSCEKDDQIKLLQRNLMKQEEHLEKLAAQNQDLQAQNEDLEILKQENISLRKALQNFQEAQKKSHEERENILLEEEWISRLAETRQMYENAIQGYKERIESLETILEEELSAKRLQEEALDKRLNDKELEKKSQEEALEKKLEEEELKKKLQEEELKKKLEEEELQKKLQEEELQKKLQEEELRKKLQEEALEKRLQEEALEKKLQEEALEKRLQEESSKSQSEEDESRQTSAQSLSKAGTLLQELEEIIQKLKGVDLDGGSSRGIDVIRDTIEASLNEMREKITSEILMHERKDSESLAKLEAKHIEVLSMKDKELFRLRKILAELEGKNQHLNEQCQLLELQSQASARNVSIEASELQDRIRALQNLPQTLQETETRLSEMQHTLSQAQNDNEQLHLKLKQLSEKLEKKDMKLKGERQIVAELKEEMSQQREAYSLLQAKLGEEEKKIIQYESEILKRDTILEQTSAQLEERIRECSRVSGEVERLRADKSQALEKLRDQLDMRDSGTSQKLLDAHGKAAKLQAQLSTLRSEKETSERTLRQQIRNLEDQMDQLRLMNSTLQKQLSAVRSTYDSMFTPLTGATLQTGFDILGPSIHIPPHTEHQH
ncbi:uncharacterized protein LOC143035052 isoform X2 [Oratosquilla oratoria]|uniref:uncharacterized protein LOC143035052 isoform X2 n=1 Tax=Oratosquilla oratoria TaxID=337810 RepID=UPI003F75907E